MSHADTLQAALEHQQAGRFPQAEQLYRQVLQADPQHHEALHLLGLLAYQVGQPPTAIDLIGRAVQLKPNSALYYNNLGLAWEATGQADKAHYCYQRACELDPYFADPHNNLGILYQSLGRLPEAIMSAQRAVQLRPDYPEALNNLASIQHALGRLSEAEQTYRHALAACPTAAQIHTNLANVLADQRRFDEAEQSFQTALAYDPTHAPAHSFRGNVLRQLGQSDAAAECYRRAIELLPQHPLGYCNLGVVLAEQGRETEALAAYQRSLELDPNFPDALNNLANLFSRLGRFDEAEVTSRRGLEHRPNSPQFLSNLGAIQQAQGNFEAARDTFQQALAIDPQNADARTNLGVALYELRHTREALECFEQALKQRPDSAIAWANRATICADLGEFDEALRSYEQAQQFAPKDGRRLKIALLTHVMYDSSAQMKQERERIANEVARLSNEPLRVTDPVEDVGASTFRLAYHAQNDRPLLESIAKLLRQATPALTYTAPHVAAPPQRAPGAKPRVGFVSRFLREHPVGHHYAGLIEQLPRDLHVTVFSFGQGDDSVTRQIRRRADEYVVLPVHLQACQQQIAQRQLDVLVHTDVGMDPLTYYLAFARLAPIQAVAAGHPVTTGIDTLDYFLSSELLEPPAGDEHYTERLVRFRSLPNRYTTPPAPPARTRRDFGLPEGVPLYVCAQTLFKIHPDFDVVVDRLLQADPQARVAFFADEQRLWGARLQRRLESRLGERLQRVLWVPRLKLPEFRAALALADVVLDTPHFSGGTSSIEALGVSAPVVTWPGQFMRGRVTHALYQKMGVLDLVAAKIDDYLRLAQRCANDRPWRDEIVAKISAKKHVLFDNDEFTQDLTAWLLNPRK